MSTDKPAAEALHKHPDDPPRAGNAYRDETANHVFVAVQSNRLDEAQMRSLEAYLKDWFETHNRPRKGDAHDKRPGRGFHHWVQIFP